MDRPDLLLFWGDTPAPDGRIGNECLSQWWPAPFTVEGRRYATAEHWMMWRKAVLFADEGVAAAVLDAPDPARAKALGRQVAGFDGQRWARERFEIVVAGSVAKFGAHPVLRDYLLGTGERVLVEASPEDAVWGIGLAASHPDAAVPERWPGTNLLGLALMRAREELRLQARW